MHNGMSHRERILAAITHQPTDRVPMDYWGVWEITQKLMNHFNVTDMLGLSRALDLDKIMAVGAPPKDPGRNGFWDIPMKRIPLPDGSGWYDEPAVYPLGGFETIDEIEAQYKWPVMDDFDFSGIKAECQRYQDAGYAVEGGYVSLTYFYEILRGTEQMLIDFAAEPELAEYILQKMQDCSGEYSRRILEAGGGLIDITQVTDDFGTQSGLIMSPAMIDGYLGNHFDTNIKMARAYGAHVFHHDDGAITSMIPWIVKKGCEVLNPLQWHLPGWNLPELKQRWGDKLCFHGGIDNQSVLPFGSVQDVQAEVRACIDALWAPDRTGYILAPCHNIQAITPVENVIAMYECCRNYKP
ncbi:uroporphyrinogen decarboxylase [Clostridia bacterium]|nr:uroporphyrinogen decarboxylase [Clostridia bacterium]